MVGTADWYRCIGRLFLPEASARVDAEFPADPSCVCPLLWPSLLSYMAPSLFFVRPERQSLQRDKQNPLGGFMAAACGIFPLRGGTQNRAGRIWQW